MHLKNFQDAKAKKSWAIARLALDKCMQTIEGEGGTLPTEWRCWKIELELTRGNWDAASNAAKCVILRLRVILYLTTFANAAMRSDWTHNLQTYWLYAVSCYFLLPSYPRRYNMRYLLFD